MSVWQLRVGHVKPVSPWWSWERYSSAYFFESEHDKTNTWPVRLAKTQISLGIRPAWSVVFARFIATTCGQQQLQLGGCPTDLSFRLVVEFVVRRFICFSELSDSFD